jgi:uncharacterized phage protein (TIGR02216 family)
MRVAFGLLRLSPGAFWAMTPVEFERAVSALGGPRVPAPGRGDLAALMRAYPDPTDKEAAIG